MLYIQAPQPTRFASNKVSAGVNEGDSTLPTSNICPSWQDFFYAAFYLFLAGGYSRWLAVGWGCQFAGPCPGDLPQNNRMPRSSACVSFKQQQRQGKLEECQGMAALLRHRHPNQCRFWEVTPSNHKTGSRLFWASKNMFFAQHLKMLSASGYPFHATCRMFPTNAWLWRALPSKILILLLENS